jgi:hypothetical protein
MTVFLGNEKGAFLSSKVKKEEELKPFSPTQAGAMHAFETSTRADVLFIISPHQTPFYWAAISAVLYGS